MTGTMKVSKLNKSKKIWVSEKDYDKALGDFYMVLEPLETYEGSAFYYSKNEDGTYTIEGECYLCTNEESVKRHKNSIRGTEVIYLEQ